MNVTVKCLDADDWILGSTVVGVSVTNEQCFANPSVVVPISMSGRVDRIEVYVHELDRSAELPLYGGPSCVKAGDSVTLDTAGRPLVRFTQR